MHWRGPISTSLRLSLSFIRNGQLKIFVIFSRLLLSLFILSKASSVLLWLKDLYYRCCLLIIIIYTVWNSSCFVIINEWVDLWYFCRQFFVFCYLFPLFSTTFVSFHILLLFLTYKITNYNAAKFEYSKIILTVFGEVASSYKNI